MFGLTPARRGSLRVFTSSDPMATRGPILPMDPREEEILAQLRANRAALDRKSALAKAARRG